MTRIKIDKIKKLNIEKGDTLVFEYEVVQRENAKKISEALGCNIIFVADIDKIGVLKTSKFNKDKKMTHTNLRVIKNKDGTTKYEKMTLLDVLIWRIAILRERLAWWIMPNDGIDYLKEMKKKLNELKERKR